MGNDWTCTAQLLGHALRGRGSRNTDVYGGYLTIRRHALRGRGSRNAAIRVLPDPLVVTPCEGVEVEIGPGSPSPTCI